MTDGRMTEGRCAQCECTRPDLGWYGVEYDDQFEKAIRFWCWPDCMVKWNALANSPADRKDRA